MVTAENVPLLEFGEPSTSPIEAPHLQDPMQQMHMEMPVHAMSTQQEVISHAPVTHYYNGVRECRPSSGDVSDASVSRQCVVWRGRDRDTKRVSCSVASVRVQASDGSRSVPNGGNVANFMNPFAHPDVILKVKHIVPRKVKRYVLDRSVALLL